MTKKNKTSLMTPTECYEQMTQEERWEHFDKMREKERQDRQKRLDHLTDEQREAISEMKKACESIMTSYYEMYHPNWVDIVDLDRALSSFKYQLNQERD